ncbi:MAG: 50S ribosomal protein L9 [Bacteroidales bacterium]|nr:50S ribosomal protein L9 [Bacteroidales bacterium]
MEIILKQDMPGLGHKDDIVTVKDGYGRNFLIPKSMAILATPTSRKIHSENLKQRAHKEANIREEAEELAKKMEEVKITIGAKTSTSGKIFGSINTVQIAEALQLQGFDVDRKNITLPGDIVKEVGKYVAIVKLHRDIKAEVQFEIVAE